MNDDVLIREPQLNSNWESENQLEFNRLRPLGNAACVACLPLLCQGSKWFNGMSVWLGFRVWIQAGSRIFSVNLFLTLSTKRHRSKLYLLCYTPLAYYLYATCLFQYVQWQSLDAGTQDSIVSLLSLFFPQLCVPEWHSPWSGGWNHAAAEEVGNGYLGCMRCMYLVAEVNKTLVQ